MSRSATKVTISGVGLDVLHLTRLKLACSLLLSEGIEADFADRKVASADLYVCDLDSQDSAAHIPALLRTTIPLLGFSRTPEARRDVRAIGRNTTVHDITQALADLLRQHGGQQQPVEMTLPPLLDILRLDQNGEDLLLIEHAEQRVLVDKTMAAIYLSDTTGDNWLEQQVSSQWKRVPISQAQKQKWLQQGTWRVLSLENFICRALTENRMQVPMPQSGLRIALKAWPDLDFKNMESEWLVPLSYLLTQSWTAEQLQRMAGIGHDSLARLLLSIQLCGLAANEEIAPKARKKTGLADARFFSWVARRFGAARAAGA